MIVKMPGVVWDDYLDPKTTTMQAELGLPDPVHRRFGRGTRVIYDTTEEIAWELVHYIEARAFTLFGDCADQRERDVHRSALEAAARIKVHLRQRHP